MKRGDLRPSRTLVLHPITPDERGRFDETLKVSHRLGAGLVGTLVRYLALKDSEWYALLELDSAVLCVRSREKLLC